MAAIDECRDSINKTEQIVNEKFNMLPHPSEEDLKKHQFVLEALAQKRKQMRDWDLDVLKGKWRGISRSGAEQDMSIKDLREVKHNIRALCPRDTKQLIDMSTSEAEKKCLLFFIMLLWVEEN